MPQTFTQGDPAKLRAFAVEAARLLSDRHCEDVILLDVRGLSQVSDYVLIASGTSDRQMRSLADEAADLGAESDYACFRKNWDSRVTWVVADFVDLVIHLFEPEQRAHYDLEALWSDAPVIDWQRGGAA